MLRCPLERIVLLSKMFHTGEPKALLALALDPPDLSNIEKTLLVLKEVINLFLNNKNFAYLCQSCSLIFFFFFRLAQWI